MKAKKLQCLTILVCLLVLQVGALAQTTNVKKSEAAKNKKAKEAPEDFIEYLNARVWETSEAIISKRRDTNQSEAPSISSNSTSLVDRSSVSDLVGLGLNLAGLSSKSDEMDATSQSVTVSFYVLKAAADGANPLDPSYYTRNRNWRKASFTLGSDYPQDKVGDVNERATILGFKYNPLDKRDGSHPDNAALINKISLSLQTTNVQFQKMRREVLGYLISEMTKPGAPFENGVPFDKTKRPTLQPGEVPLSPSLQLRADFENVLEETATFRAVVLPFLERDEVKREIDEIIARYVGTVAEFRETVLGTLEEIRKKAQISFAFFTKQRKGDRADEHQFKAIFDKGVTPRWNFTLNAGFDYVDNKMMKDTKAGMVSIASQIHLNRDNLEGSMPWTVSLSGEGSWMTDQGPMYVGQAKLTIPLAFGVEFPLSISFANRTELIKETDIKGRFGFTFDLSRIAQAFSGGLLKKK